MRKMLLLMAGASLLAGCATKEMKSTPFYEGGEVEYVGEVSDRVNLWPVAYWRNPVGSVVWPVVSFSDDHFAFRPVYSQYKQSGKNGAWDEFNFVWPLAQADTKRARYHFFPANWGKDDQGCGYQSVFPIYWNGAHYNSLFPVWYYGSTTNSWHFNTLAGLAGACRTKNDYRASWTFPLWYEDSTGLFTTLLYGQTRDSHWLFPLWYKGEKAFVSPFYAQGEDGDKSWWAVPALLSWGRECADAKAYGKNGSILLSLGGWDEKRNSHWHTGGWWAFPLVNRSWSEPLAQEKGKPFVKTRLACSLAGWASRDEKLESHYVAPLYYWHENGSWLTPLGGQIHVNTYTNTLVTPLVSMRSGDKTGGWVIPIWARDKDIDFDERLAEIDSPTLPDRIRVSVQTNACKRGRNCGTVRFYGQTFYRGDHTAFLLHDINHSIRGENRWAWQGDVTNQYDIVEHVKRGNRLLLNYEYDRRVAYDLKTRAKLSDRESRSSGFMLLLYDYGWKRNRTTGEEEAHYRVLWRLWNWEEKAGAVSLDVFPGFTYDSRADGYAKTSFLWRFFRYERDPNAGTSIDLLYLPIWRGLK